MKKLTAREAAARLGLSSAQVRKLARDRGIGTKVQAGPISAWTFSEQDITEMRRRPRPGPAPREGK